MTVSGSEPESLVRVTMHALRNLNDGPRVARRVAEMVVAFSVLTLVAWHRVGPSVIDVRMLYGYRANATSRTFRVAQVITAMGSPGVVVVLGFLVAGAVWIRRRSLPWVLACLGAPAVAGVIEASLKTIVARQRPISAVLTGEAGNGFPSGHAAGFSALALTIAFYQCTYYRNYHRAAIATAVIGSIIIGVTRVLVGAHYPIDVVAGILLGFGVSNILTLFARNAEQLATRFHSCRRERTATTST